MKYEITSYLRDKTTDGYGYCKTCGQRIFWGRQKLESHKSGGKCNDQNSAEKQMFTELKMVSVSRSTPSPHIMATETLAVQKFIKINNQPTSERRIEQWIDKLCLNKKDKCDKALAYFFYRTGVFFSHY